MRFCSYAECPAYVVVQGVSERICHILWGVIEDAFRNKNFDTVLILFWTFRCLSVRGFLFTEHVLMVNSMFLHPTMCFALFLLFD